MLSDAKQPLCAANEHKTFCQPVASDKRQKMSPDKLNCVFSQDRVVIAVAYDCVDKMIYWTDITGPAISKASLDGGDIIPVISKGTADIRGQSSQPSICRNTFTSASSLIPVHEHNQ